MTKDALRKLFSISLKTRMLRAWQEANEGGERLLSDREVLVLGLVDEFANWSVVTESVIRKILGLSPSSASDLVSRLSTLGLIIKEPEEKGQSRGKGLRITPKGAKQLEHIKNVGAARFAYLFGNVSEENWDRIVGLLQQIDLAATQAVRKFIFGQYELDFEQDEETEG